MPQTFGPGQLPATTTTVQQSGLGASASLMAVPSANRPQGTIGLGLVGSAMAYIQSSSSPPGSYSYDADLVLSIGPASMGAAVLVVSWHASSNGSTCSLAIDVGNDGTWELTGSVGTFTPQPMVLAQELGLPIASNSQVRVRMQASGQALLSTLQVQ